MRVSGVSEATPLVRAEPSIGPSTDLAANAPGEVSFGDVFAKTVAQANRADRVAAGKVEALALGAADDLHGTMIAVKEADISMRLVGTIRNKLLDAFTEIWKTSV
jgi:flagellar hook-basal body complex protein FliE